MCVGVLAHHSRGLHGEADDHDDAAFVVVEDSRRGALQELTVRAERWAERHVDAPRNMASAEAGTSGVKEDGTGPETSRKWQNPSGAMSAVNQQCQNGFVDLQIALIYPTEGLHLIPFDDSRYPQQDFAQDHNEGENSQILSKCTNPFCPRELAPGANLSPLEFCQRTCHYQILAPLTNPYWLMAL